jgi:catechol 2,3-dioxygenase-like lactoylglutathione lyase family enzyme
MTVQSMAMSDNQTRVGFEGSSPIFRIENMEASVRYCVDILGFQNVSWGNDEFTRVNRGGACIFLCRGDQGAGQAWAWLGVDDAGKLFEEYQATGAKIRMQPTNFPWAREIHVEDLDGNVLRLGSDPE